MELRLNRRAAFGAVMTTTLAAPPVANAQARPTVRFAYDWIRNGPYAFGIAGERQGFFREAGVDLTIQRGFGSARVPLDMAAGTFDIAMADPTPVLRFMSQNPNTDLVAVSLLWDQAPTARSTPSPTWRARRWPRRNSMAAARCSRPSPR